MLLKNKITFIISTKNDTRGLLTTLKSLNTILKQSDYELIIKDCNSIVKPKYIIKDFKNVSYYASNHDKSIYDAWNQSMKHVCTRYVSFLGAGDKVNYNYKDFLKIYLSKKNYDFAYCKANIITKKKIIGKKSLKKQWPFIMPVIHVGGIFSYNFLKNNNFNSDYKIAGDYDVFFRTKKKIKIEFYNKVCIHMKPGGISQDHKNFFLRLNEMYKSIKENYNITIAIAFVFLNLILKFIKK